MSAFEVIQSNSEIQVQRGFLDLRSWEQAVVGSTTAYALLLSRTAAKLY
jgi:hypothetical protein